MASIVASVASTTQPLLQPEMVSPFSARVKREAPRGEHEHLRDRRQLAQFQGEAEQRRDQPRHGQRRRQTFRAKLRAQQRAEEREPEHTIKRRGHREVGLGLPLPRQPRALQHHRRPENPEQPRVPATQP